MSDRFSLSPQEFEHLIENFDEERAKYSKTPTKHYLNFFVRALNSPSLIESHRYLISLVKNRVDSRDTLYNILSERLFKGPRNDSVDIQLCYDLAIADHKRFIDEIFTSHRELLSCAVTTISYNFIVFKNSQANEYLQKIIEQQPNDQKTKLKDLYDKAFLDYLKNNPLGIEDGTGL